MTNTDPPNIDKGQPPVIEPTFAPEQATASSDYYAAAPNMIGDFLGGGLGIAFPYTTQAVPSFAVPAIPGDVLVDLNAFTALSDAKIAENNSPLPINRVYFRYNYFDNTNSVGGQDLCSVELRVPFYNRLGSDQNLVAGEGDVIIGGPSTLQFTPEQTLGEYDTEFGNLNVILKGLLYYTPSVAVAAGLGISAPTGPDANVQVVDLYSAFGTGLYNSLRTRTFHVENEAWALSPYLGVLLQPNDRLFLQGFCQLYLPIGDNGFSYNEDLVEFGEPRPGFRTATGDLDAQSFMMVDVGLGYWLLRSPEPQGLTGLAGLVELHYTTAIEDGDIVVLPADGVLADDVTPQSAPRIGNLRNRVDFLNLTVGAVAEFSNRLLITSAFCFPLQDDDNRYFDWEFQLQLNYRFGPAPAYLAPM
jgi:hypothetical protein